MMKNEFEKLAGYEVSMDTYKNIIEPMYMRSECDKHTFIKNLKKMREALEEKHHFQKILVGVKPMPNGTWMTYEAELIDVNIKTGKTLVRRLSENRCWAETWFDIFYARVTEIQ